MSEDLEAPEDALKNDYPTENEEHSDYKPADTKDVKAKYQLSGMYQNWFLDYASTSSWNVPCHTSMTD